MAQPPQYHRRDDRRPVVPAARHSARQRDTSTPPRGRRHSRVLIAAAGLYLAIWVATAIAPLDRFGWFLENMLVFMLIGALLATYRRFPLSTASYMSIVAFLTIHAVGAHYTYSKMPLGFVAKDLFGFARNHYDRFTHFAFGLLFAYPAREIVMRSSDLRGMRLAVSVVVAILAMGAGYELVEWWVAILVDPSAAHAYLGTQGDVFDAQKDQSFALAGAIIALALTAVLANEHRHWRWRRNSSDAPPSS